MGLSQSQIRDVLVDARALVAKPDNWLRDYLAKSADGSLVEPTDWKATRFCARGAILRSLKVRGFNARQESQDERKVCRTIVVSIGLDGLGLDVGAVARWNNNIDDHSRLLAGLDATIASL